MWVRSLSCLAILVAATFAGCADDEATDVAPAPVPTSTTGSGNAGQGGGGGAGGEDMSTGQGGAAATPPVYLGLATAPSGAGSVAPAEAQLAELTALAAGVRTVRIDVAWSDFDLPSLEARVVAHAEDDRRVVVRLLVVDRLRALRPEAFGSDPWDDPELITALRNDVDAIGTLGEGAVAAVAIGAEVDAYLEGVPAEASALTTLLTAAVDAAPATVLVGVGLSTASLLEPLSTNVEHLVGLGSAATLSYRPGEGLASAAAASPAKDLDAVSLLVGDRPIILTAVGFSSSGVDQTATTQRQNLDGFFAALRPRRALFPYVIVEQVNDLSAERCAVLAEAQSETLEGTWATHRCHTGLRDAEDAAKPAWVRFLQASAELASP